MVSFKPILCYQNAIALTIIIWYFTMILPIPNRRLCQNVLVVRRYNAYVILMVHLWFIMLSVLVLQQMNKPCIQVMSQLATICVDVHVSFFMPHNREFFMNSSSALFIMHDEVTLPTNVAVTLLTGVSAILPTHFWVKTCFQVNAFLECDNTFTALDRVNYNTAFEWVNKSTTCVCVYSYFRKNIASEWVNMFTCHV